MKRIIILLFTFLCIQCQLKKGRKLPQRAIIYESNIAEKQDGYLLKDFIKNSLEKYEENKSDYLFVRVSYGQDYPNKYNLPKYFLPIFNLEEVKNIEESPYYEAYFKTNRFLNLKDSIYLPVVFQQDLYLDKQLDSYKNEESEFIDSRFIYTIDKEVKEKMLAHCKFEQENFHYIYFYVNIGFADFSKENIKGLVFSLSGYSEDTKEYEGVAEQLRNKTNRFLKLSDTLYVPVFFKPDNFIKNRRYIRKLGGNSGFLVDKKGKLIDNWIGM